MTRRKHRRGFTLTEIAIVLGVIGILTGAIWTASTSVTQSNRVNQAVQDIQQIVDNIRSMYMGASNFGVTAATIANTTVIAAGAIPSHLVTGAASMVNAWNGAVIIFFNPPAPLSTVSRTFRIAYYGTPRDACVGILSQLANQGTADGPIYVATGCGTVGSTITTAGLTLPVINGLCSTASPTSGCMSTELDYAIH